MWPSLQIIINALSMEVIYGFLELKGRGRWLFVYFDRNILFKMKPGYTLWIMIVVVGDQLICTEIKPTFMISS